MRTLALVLTVAVGQLGFVHEPEKAEPIKSAKTLPDDVTKSWRDAGASPGWTEIVRPVSEKPGRCDIPVFEFQE